MRRSGEKRLFAEVLLPYITVTLDVSANYAGLLLTFPL